MQSFKKLTSKVIPLPYENIDTDMIIPAEFLKSVERGGYGANLFRRLRDQDKEFPLNLERYKDAQILVTERNFGCGSSREHAVWALLGAGIRAVLAPSFADIFANNSVKNGLVLVKLPETVIKDILSKTTRHDYEVTVDLEEQIATLAGGAKIEFPFDPFRKECILKGLDDFGYLMAEMQAIKAFKKKQQEILDA